MLVTLAGMVSVPLRPVPLKALVPMARLPESGSSNFVMPDRSRNALSPMLVTLAGMVSVPLRLVPWKALTPMTARLAACDKSKVVRVTSSRKASKPISVTL